MLAFWSRSSATKRSRQLGEVARPQQVRDVAHRPLGEQPQTFRFHAHELLAGALERRDVVLRDQPVGGVVPAERQHFLELKIGHLWLLESGAREHIALVD
jgi:hypothetical protein